MWLDGAIQPGSSQVGQGVGAAKPVTEPESQGLACGCREAALESLSGLVGSQGQCSGCQKPGWGHWPMTGHM